MSMPAEDTLDREKDKLYLTDAELIRRLGVPRDKGYQALQAFDRDPRSGFPKKQALWGGRRFWPAVEAFLMKANGLTISNPQRRNPHD